MKKPAQTKQHSKGTKKLVKRTLEESITEVLATTPKSAWKSWPELWKEYPKSGDGKRAKK